MSVIPVTRYQAKCDTCGQPHEDAEGYGIADDRAYALELATDAGWLQVRGAELRCPSCLNCDRCGESPAWVGGHDHWPTPDGKPFTEQSLNWWEVVAACARSNHADPECACPAWLPADLTPYLPQPAGFDYPSYLDPPKYTRRIGDDGETPDYATGYPGAPGYDVIAVPIAPTRRFMQRSGPAAMAKQLCEWGCRAHVERAEVGAWERVP